MWLRPDAFSSGEDFSPKPLRTFGCPRNEQEKTAVAGFCMFGGCIGVYVVRASQCRHGNQAAGAFDGMETGNGGRGYRRWGRTVLVRRGGTRGRFRKSDCDGNRCAENCGAEV